ncbi:hypothetical protein FDU21_09555 [Xanthomonas oryzae pv. oryzae]|nr:hypothetical protein FDU21_09555 [Xanthomonas oryzae pv. oryzae]
MKTRFALTLMALLPILVACKAQDGSSDTAPAATTSAAGTAPAPAAAAPATDPAAPPAVGESATTPPPAAPSAARARPMVPSRSPAPIIWTSTVASRISKPQADRSGRSLRLRLPGL